MDVESMIGQKRKISIFSKSEGLVSSFLSLLRYLYMGSIMKTYEGVEVQEVANDPRTQDAPEES